MNLAIFERFKTKLEDIPRQMPTIIQEEMRDQKEFIIALNQEQLERGKNADETPIEPLYAPSTVRIKKKKGQQSRWVTLEDTGKFRRGMDAFFTKDKMTLFSRDSKNDKLVEKYGRRFFGVAPSSRSELKEKLRPFFINRVRKLL